MSTARRKLDRQRAEPFNALPMENYRITLRQKGFVWNEAKRAYEKVAPMMTQEGR